MKANIALVFLLDTSGSMAAHTKEYESAMREYFDTLKRDPNADYKLVLVEFDTLSKVKIVGKDLKDFNFPLYKPVGRSTNVYDAVFTATDTADKWLAGEAKEGRTYNVLFVMLTDGEHNHIPAENFDRSLIGYCTHTMNEVREKLKEKESTGYWTLVYLGANQDAWAVADSIGIATGYTFVASAQGIPMAGAAMAGATLSYSSNASRGNATSSKDFWNDEDDGTAKKPSPKLSPSRLP